LNGELEELQKKANLKEQKTHALFIAKQLGQTRGLIISSGNLPWIDQFPPWVHVHILEGKIACQQCLLSNETPLLTYTTRTRFFDQMEESDATTTWSFDDVIYPGVDENMDKKSMWVYLDGKKTTFDELVQDLTSGEVHEYDEDEIDYGKPSEAALVTSKETIDLAHWAKVYVIQPYPHKK